jgi:hypothetical protein
MTRRQVQLCFPDTCQASRHKNNKINLLFIAVSAVKWQLYTRLSAKAL